MLNICTKCGYVQRELVCLLLPTSSVNNNNNTCDFIYCHVITSFEYVARTQACTRCSFHPKFNFLHFIGNYFRNLKVKKV